MSWGEMSWRDAGAGLALFLVSVPLSLGIAHASGAPALAGIIATAVGGLVVGVISGSPIAVSGPAAGLSAITLWGVETLGSFDALLVAILLAGVLQLALAAARAEAISKLVPVSVARGMITAIGVLLVVKQLPHVIGADSEALKEDDFLLAALRDMLFEFHGGALVVGLVSFAFITAWDTIVPERFRRLLPGLVLVVPLGILVAALIAILFPALALSEAHLLYLPQMHGLASLFAPALRYSELLHSETWMVAGVLGSVASLETLLAVDALERLDPERRKVKPHQELIAQGIGNITSGLLGGLPLTIVIVRSSVNLSAGARSRLGALSAGVLTVGAILLAEPLLRRIPLATLAALLISVGLHLIDPSSLRQMWNKGPAVAVPFCVTVIAIVWLNLLTGVLIGLGTAGIFILAGLYKTANFHIEGDGHMTRIRLGEDVSFFHKAQLRDAFDAIPEGQIVYIDGSRSLQVDEDIIDLLASFRAEAPARNIAVVVGGIGRISSYTEEHRHKMDDEYARLITNNREWVKERLNEDAEFFKKSSAGQSPHFLFVGCSDSRVPAETITKTDPGNLFVHRNIANVVSLSDVNLLSVLQYSVEVLNVPHIIVCGHYGCGGVKAALSQKSFGLIDNWITPIKWIVQQNRVELCKLSGEDFERRVIELHVIEQVRNLFKTNLVQNAIKKYGSPRVHGWVYDLATGLINDLDVKPDIALAIDPVFRFDK